MEDKFKFGELKKNIEQMKRELPIKLANEAQNYFVKSFSDQGWDGKGWKDVKRHDKTTPEYKYPIALRPRKLSSPILVGVHRGRSGGRLRAAVSRSIRLVTFNRIRLVVDLPYAARHNEGRAGMPQRQFMGNSPILMQQHRETVKRFMSGLWEK